MNIETKAMIALAISIILIVLNTKLYYGGKTRKQVLVKEAKAKGNIVIADAIKNVYSYGLKEIKKPNGHFASEKVTYEYIVNGKRYHFKEKYVGRDQTHCDFPLSIRVYYDEENPKRIAFDFDVSKQGQFRGSIISGAIIFFAGTFVILQVLNYLF